jgi:hypothetical protein
MTTSEWYSNLLSGQPTGQQPNVPPPYLQQPPWMQGPDLGPSTPYSNKWAYVDIMGNRVYHDDPSQIPDNPGWYPWVDPMKEQQWTTGVGHIGDPLDWMSRKPTPAPTPPKDNFYDNLMKWIFSGMDRATTAMQKPQGIW